MPDNDLHSEGKEQDNHATSEDQFNENLTEHQKAGTSGHLSKPFSNLLVMRK